MGHKCNEHIWKSQSNSVEWVFSATFPWAPGSACFYSLSHLTTDLKFQGSDATSVWLLLNLLAHCKKLRNIFGKAKHSGSGAHSWSSSY